MHKLLSFFVLLFLSCSLFAEDMQCENKLIEQILVKMMNQPNDAAADTSAIEARIKTKANTIFNQTDFDNDLKKLSEDFDRIDPEVECIHDKVYITLNIWPKPSIRLIKFHGNEKMSGEILTKELGISRAAIFDRYTFNQAFHKLKTYYVKQGFFEAELYYDLIRDPHSNQIDILININEGRAGKIKEIQFINFTNQEKEDVMATMATTEYSFFTSWFTEAGTYHEEAVQQDELTIINYLQNLGYADARVKINILEAPQSDRIILTITADKGPIYHVGKLAIKGNQILSEEEIYRCLRLEEGSCFSPEKLRDISTRITNLYGRHGYIDAFVNFVPRLSLEEYVYDVDFYIEEGKPFRIGLIKVFGNYWTQTNVILHETLLIPGDVFNLEKLQITEERLRNIGFFKTVNVYAVKSEAMCSETDNYRDVHIEVAEGSTGHFGAFLGFSTSEDVFGGFNITESNFNHRGLKYIWSEGLGKLRGGGEYLHFTATLGMKSQSYVLSWSKPYFNDTPWVVGFDLERSTNKYISDDFDFKTTSATIRGMYPINPFLRFGVNYRLKYTHIPVTHDKENCKLREEARNSGFLAGLGASLVYDSTNHPLRPTRGFKSRLEGEVANMSDQRMFFSTAYLNTYIFQFKPYDERGVWKFKWDLRFIQPMLSTTIKKVPLDERLFLGGDDTIRGYRPYRPGPKFRSCDGKHEHTDDPRGGLSLQFVSLEYSLPIWRQVELFCFADAGHLSTKTWHFGRFYSSVGYGVKIPVFDTAPPLILGYGFTINPRRKTDVKRFFLSVGGRF